MALARIEAFTFFRLKITVGCLWSTNPSIHFSLVEDTLMITVGCLVWCVVCGVWCGVCDVCVQAVVWCVYVHVVLYWWFVGVVCVCMWCCAWVLCDGGCGVCVFSLYFSFFSQLSSLSLSFCLPFLSSLSFLVLLHLFSLLSSFFSFFSFFSFSLSLSLSLFSSRHGLWLRR